MSSISTTTTSPPSDPTAAAPPALEVGGGLAGWNLSALTALYVAAFRSAWRPRRLAILGLIFGGPPVLALAFRLLGVVNDSNEASKAALSLIDNFYPNLIIPLASLLFATGLIRDEVEDQTLTYLLVSPVARPAIYLMKLKAACHLTILLVVGFAALSVALLTVGVPIGSEAPAIGLNGRLLKTMAMFALAIVAYSTWFGLLGLVTRYATTIGVVQIILLENLLVGFDFLLRQATIIYHVRALTMRWLEITPANWNMTLDTLPEASFSLEVLLGVILVSTAAAMILVKTREFRVKTPEG